MDKNSFYRKIPKVDVLLGEKEAEELIQEYGYSAVCGAVRSALQQERERVGAKRPGKRSGECYGGCRGTRPVRRSTAPDL